MSSEEQLLELAARAARMAGGLLAERASRGTEHGVTSKSTPTDLVSEADTASEQAIRELLAAERPQDGFLGEEGGGSGGASGLTWIVDPLDGTIDYLFGIPQWCVSIAVRDGRGTVAGAIYDPNRDELFTAGRSGPAELLAAAGRRELRGRTADPQDDASGSALARAMVATGFGYDAAVRAAQAEVLAELIPRVRDIRRFGSAALDLAWTAAGRWDAYFERSVKEWDVAAGRLICERAGLEARELAPTPELPWGLLVSRPDLVEELGAIVGA